MNKRKKAKKGNVHPSPLDPRLMETWNQGFNAGARQQRESDIDSLVKLLEDLEAVPGVGGKTAEKLREYFLSQFGK